MELLGLPIDLSNKNAWVGGASAGIGKAIALQLAKQKANVVIAARSKHKLETLLEELNTIHPDGKHAIAEADYSQVGMLQRAAENQLKTYKAFHILINNTGGPAPGKAIDAGYEQFIQAFNQHLIAAHTLTQTFVSGMKTEAYGRIINIISTSVKQPLPGLGVSNTIRAAVANWSKTLSQELAEFGITVNNVLPGATSTERLTQIISNKADKAKQSEETVSQHMMNEIPAKRFGLPEELGYVVGFLASPAAAYINGINLPVDGGRTLSL